MAEQKGRPVPKQRSVHAELPRQSEPFSTADMYGRSIQEPPRNIKASKGSSESSPDTSGLPSCVQLRNMVVSADQKQTDSYLPGLMHKLDEACKKCSNDAEKFDLAILCLRAASSPIRKYRILRYFELLENNKNEINRLPGALSILEKYAINLLRDEKPVQWKEIKYSTSIIQNTVFPVVGALNVLQQMGYTQVGESALTFPSEVEQPNIPSIVVLTADLSIARHETDALIHNRHPFLIFGQFGSSPGNTPEAALESTSVGADPGSYVSGYCGVCSEQNLARACADCDMQFCQDCDERWHNHKLRRSHVRTPLSNKTSEEKTSTRHRPTPVPRKRKSQKAEADNSQSFQEPSARSGEGTSSGFPHNPADNQEIKRPPHSGNMTSHGDMTSPGRMTSHGDMTSPARMASPARIASPGNMRSPARMTSPGNMTSPGRMTSPGNTRSPARMTSPGNMNIHVNPSQNLQYINPTYGAAQQQPTFQPPDRNPGAQSFHQSGGRRYDFSQSGEQAQGSNQSGRKTLRRVLSCPNCSLLFPDAQATCPSCNVSLKSGSDVTTFTPSSQQAGFNSSKPANNLPPASDQALLKDLAQELSNRRLPELPRAPGVATRVNHVVNTEYEEPDKLLEWCCEHCTFSNPLSTKVCQACCKTPSDPKKFPNLVEKSPPPPLASNADTVRPQQTTVVPTGTQQDHRAVFMTPKDRPLEGGIYMSTGEGESLPLPAKKRDNDNQFPEGRIVNAQKYREQELTEKEKGNLFLREKEELLQQGLITNDEFYTISTSDELRTTVEARKVWSSQASPVRGLNNDRPVVNHGSHLMDEQLLQLLYSGVVTQQDLINNGVLSKPNVEPRPGGESRSCDAGLKPTKNQHSNNPLYDVPTKTQDGKKDDLYVSEEQLLQLLSEGVFQDVKPAGAPSSQPSPHPPSHQPPSHQPPSAPYLTQVSPGSKLTEEERYQLYQAGIVSMNYLQNASPDFQPIYDVPKYDHPPAYSSDIESMFAEFQTLETVEPPAKSRQNYATFQNKNTTYQNYNVRRNAPVLGDIYDKLSKPLFTSLPSQSSKDSFSSYLNSQVPLEQLKRKNFIDDESKLYVEWIKEADKYGFTPEELNIANHFIWQDPKERNPVQWLNDEWTGLVAQVIGKVTELTSNENDRVGNLSTDEAKKALLENHGSVESACKACIESRREKLAKMGEISIFSRVDCLNALDRNNGDLDQALLELEQKAMEPIKKRVLGLQDQEDGEAKPTGLLQTYEEVVRNKDISFERRVRVVYVEKKIQSWGRAETAVKLVDMGFNVEDCIEAANAFGDLRRSLVYLQQECPICTEEKPMGQMITFLSCQDKICKECVAAYLTHRVREFQIHQIVCPVCDLPDLSDEAEAADYFNNLDVMVRELVDPEVHDVFQKKLRDRALRKEENFRWCAHCSCGFINELPNVNKMQCPNCLNFTCFGCKKPWEDQHEGITCEQFAQWKLENDEEFQLAGLAGHLARNGIDCPECKFRYDLARGGCMHFKCGQCGHEFCSGCYNPFKHRGKCNILQSCQGMGMHAHHPRDCLFYMRDWIPERLQELLQENGIDYKAGARGLPVQDDEIGGEDDEEAPGAFAGNVQKCKVMEQREQGIEDTECARPCQPGHDGLCRIHYIEYLVDLINKNGIDPADKMDIDEMTLVHRREEIQAPPQEEDEDNAEFRERLLAHLKQQIPLPRPPALRLPAGEEQEE